MFTYKGKTCVLDKFVKLPWLTIEDNRYVDQYEMRYCVLSQEGSLYHCNMEIKNDYIWVHPSFSEKEMDSFLAIKFIVIEFSKKKYIGHYQKLALKFMQFIKKYDTDLKRDTIKI